MVGQECSRRHDVRAVFVSCRVFIAVTSTACIAIATLMAKPNENPNEYPHTRPSPHVDENAFAESRAR